VPNLIEAYQAANMDMLAWVKGPMRSMINEVLQAEQHARDVFERFGVVLRDTEDGDNSAS